MKTDSSRPTGMTAFVIIWIGQILSLLGTAISNFGLTLWAWEVSGKATSLTLVGFFFTLPMVVLSPIVGVLVDRANRKLMMMLSDFAAAATTLFILILYVSGSLEIWHLYIAAFISGTFQGFQFPAYSTAITTMLDKKHYARANSMLEMAGAASGIFAPMLAGALIGPLGLKGLLSIDLISASFAIGSLLFVNIPQPVMSETGRQAQGNFWKQAIYGFDYIFKRPSLLGLQTIFLSANFFFSIAFAVFAPMILGRTNNNEVIFGSVQSAFAVGGLVGGLVMSVWGGPKRRIHGLMATAVAGVATKRRAIARITKWTAITAAAQAMTLLASTHRQVVAPTMPTRNGSGIVALIRLRTSLIVRPYASSRTRSSRT